MMLDQKKSATGTAAAILDAAELMAQARGYNGFSFGDIAKRLGITTATIHYHFPSKADLGERLIARYTEGFAALLREIEAQQISPREQLHAYVKIYEDVLASGRFCLCGMLAAEVETLSPEMEERLRAFFNANTDWLTKIITKGQGAGDFALRESTHDLAAAIVGGLEGAMLVARAYGGVKYFRSSVKVLLDRL